MLLSWVLSMFFPSCCAACGSPGPALCHRCRFSLASTGHLRTTEGVAAAFPFEGVARQLIVALKFRHRRSAADVLAEQMVRRMQLAPVDVVTWAPTSSSRVRRRGYDQAEVIARAVARRLGVPCSRLLYRSHGSPQTGKSRAERLTGAAAFRARPPRQGLKVLLVDDVVTTGATLRSASDALLAAGVAQVEVAAAASTQRRPPVGSLPAWASSIASSAPVKARS